jgi:hypothetical protein
MSSDGTRLSQRVTAIAALYAWLNSHRSRDSETGAAGGVCTMKDRSRQCFEKIRLTIFTIGFTKKSAKQFFNRLRESEPNVSSVCA